MAKTSQSSQMIRVSNEIVELIPELNRLAREGKPIADALQKMIDRLTHGTPDTVDSSGDQGDRTSTTPAPADPELLEILQRLEGKIDRIAAQPKQQPQAAPAEILNFEELMRRKGVNWAQLSMQSRTSGLPIEKVLEQRCPDFRYLGSGNYIKR